MKKVFFLLLAAGIFASAPSLAQSSFSVQYSMGFGSGDTQSFISQPSFRGAAIAYQYLIQPKVSVGVDVGWNVFYERKDYETYTNGSAALSGVQFRYINAVPIFLSGDYYLKPGEKINPFVGLGIGTLFTRRNLNMNLYTVENNVWAFGLRPEVGVLVSANPSMDFIIAAKYNYGFSAGGLEAQSYIALNVGFVFKKY